MCSDEVTKLKSVQNKPHWIKIICLSLDKTLKLVMAAKLDANKVCISLEILLMTMTCLSNSNLNFFVQRQKNNTSQKLKK